MGATRTNRFPPAVVFWLSTSSFVYRLDAVREKTRVARITAVTPSPGRADIVSIVAGCEHLPGPNFDW